MGDFSEAIFPKLNKPQAISYNKVYFSCFRASVVLLLRHKALLNKKSPTVNKSDTREHFL